MIRTSPPPATIWPSSTACSAVISRPSRLSTCATKIYQQQQPAAPPLLALNLAVASCVGRGWGHDAKALADAGKALVLAQKGLSNADHPYLAAILDNLMAVDTGQARYAEAYAHGSRASTLIKQLWGDKHPYLAMNLDGLAQVEIAEGKLAAAQDKTEVAQDHFARAEKLCGDALAIVQHAFGPKFVWVAEIQYTRARLEIARDAPYNARPYLEEARKSGKPPSWASTIRPWSASWETSPRWTTIRP